jgi:hypothetical protein
MRRLYSVPERVSASIVILHKSVSVVVKEGVESLLLHLRLLLEHPLSHLVPVILKVRPEFEVILVALVACRARGYARVIQQPTK